MEQQTQQPIQSKCNYVLNYFNKVGKVNLCKLIFAAANVNFKDNFVEDLTDSDVQFGFAPFLEVESVHIPLVSVICRFLAREFNLMGESSLDQARTDAIAQNCMLLIDSYYKNVYEMEDRDQKAIGLKAYLDKDVPNSAREIEKLINIYSVREDSEFCVGKQLTYADLFIYEMAAYYFPTDSAFAKQFPRIFGIKKAVETNSLISIYLETSPQYNRVEKPYQGSIDMIEESKPATKHTFQSQQQKKKPQVEL